MLSILFLSQMGEGYGLAYQVSKKGHISKFWASGPILEPQAIVKRPKVVNRYEDHVESADLIVCCGPGYGGVAEALRERGKMVLGGRVQDLLSTEEWQVKIAEMLELGYSPDYEASNSIYTSGWFNGQEWLVTFVGYGYNRMLDKDRGPITPSMGVVMGQEDETLLHKLTVFLRESGFVGYLSLKINIDDNNQPLLTEVNPFFDDTTLSASSEILKESLDHVLYRLAKGTDAISFGHQVYGMAVKLGFINISHAKMYPHEGALKHFWPETLPSIVGSATARGFTIREAQRRVYRTVQTLADINLIYRSDIGQEHPWKDNYEVSKEGNEGEGSQSTLGEQRIDDGAGESDSELAS